MHVVVKFGAVRMKITLSFSYQICPQKSYFQPKRELKFKISKNPKIKKRKKERKKEKWTLF